MYCKFTVFIAFILFGVLSSFISLALGFSGFIIFSKVFLSWIMSPSEFDSSTIFFISRIKPFILLLFPFSLMFLYFSNKLLILMNKSLYNLE